MVEDGAGAAVEFSAVAVGEGDGVAAGADGAVVAVGEAAGAKGAAGVPGAGASTVAADCVGPGAAGPDGAPGTTATAVPVPSAVSVQRTAVKRKFLVEAGRNGMRNLPVGYAGAGRI